MLISDMAISLALPILLERDTQTGVAVRGSPSLSRAFDSLRSANFRNPHYH